MLQVQTKAWHRGRRFNQWEKNHTDAPLKCILIVILLENSNSKADLASFVSLGTVRWLPDGTWAHTSDITTINTDQYFDHFSDIVTLQL